MKHWPSILIIIVSAILMQWHSIAFWLEYAGHTGVGFSLALEVVALWLWWQRRPWLAIVASALLVGGPLFQLSAPVMETLTKTDVNQALVVSYEQEINQLNNSLSRYDTNSAKRLGWSSRIDRAQTELTQARNKLRELLSVRTPETPLRLYMIVIMQALALIIIMRAQIIAITTLPLITIETPIKPKPSKPVDPVIRRRVKTDGPGKIKIVTVKEKSTDFDNRVSAIAAKIRQRLPEYEGKQRALADDIEVRPADISMALNHTERSGRGAEILSEPKLLKIEKAMETTL